MRTQISYPSTTFSQLALTQSALPLREMLVDCNILFSELDTVFQWHPKPSHNALHICIF